MKESKLVQLMKGLSAEDLRQIQKMTKSPFFTSNKNLGTLFTLLRSYHPEMDTKKLEKHKVFAKVFSQHSYSDIKLRNLNSDMVRIIEDYLIYKETESNKFARKKKLVKIYKEQGHFDLFEKTLKELLRELNESPFRDHLYYKEMLGLKLLHLEYIEIKKPNSRYEILGEWEVILDHFYDLSKARHRMTLKSLQKIIQHSKEEEKPRPEEDNILYHLYNQFEKLYDSDDLQLFEAIQKTFEEKIHFIRRTLQIEFLSLLINFGIKQMSIDDEKYNQVVLDLYKLGLQHQLIFTNDLITHTAYFNIVVCGSKAKDFKWTLQFIDTYKSFLPEMIRQDSEVMSRSAFHYHRKDFSKAIELLSCHKFKDVMLKRTSKIHEIRCYYEIALKEDATYFDLLIDRIPNNGRFVRRNEFTKARETSHLNFLSFVKKLATLRLSGKLTKKQQIMMQGELEDKKTILSRSWLREKIKQ